MDKYRTGQRLVIELTSLEVFEGDFVYATENRIDLNNIYTFPNCSEIKEIQCFYKNEIRNVKVIDEPSSDESKEECSFNSSLESHSPELILLSKSEYDRLKEMAYDFTYMATTDRRYKEAVDDLLNSENIGVVGLGSQHGRSNKLQLLLLSTWNHVYIFDILSFNRKDFEPELKEILESSNIRKVVHDSKGIVDCLYHCHNVNMQNIFDTQVADLLIIKTETGKSPTEGRMLSECLAHYFHLGRNVIETAENSKMKKWEKRPLSQERKIRAAVLVTYLITLKNKMEDILLQDLHKAIKIYCNVAKDASSYDSLMITKNSKVPENIFRL